MEWGNGGCGGGHIYTYIPFTGGYNGTIPLILLSDQRDQSAAYCGQGGYGNAEIGDIAYEGFDLALQEANTLREAATATADTTGGGKNRNGAMIEKGL